MTRNLNHDASSRKSFKTCDIDDHAPWADLINDVLFLVMMQLGVIDFLAFSGVCKSWRSFALSNMNKFMASDPPMPFSMCTKANKVFDHGNNKKDYCCYLENFEGKVSKTILPHPANTTCVGSASGYLIFYGRKTHDYRLINPVTRHELHFPSFIYPFSEVEAILVFSPSISGWVFAMIYGISNISFSIAGHESWNHVSSTFRISSLHAFKGKIYTIHNSCHLCELRLKPELRFRFLITKNFPSFFSNRKLISFRENLYMMGRIQPKSPYGLYRLLNFKEEIDFKEEMNWVSCEKTSEEFAFFHSRFVIKGKLERSFRESI